MVHKASQSFRVLKQCVYEMKGIRKKWNCCVALNMNEFWYYTIQSTCLPCWNSWFASQHMISSSDSEDEDTKVETLEAVLQVALSKLKVDDGHGSNSSQNSSSLKFFSIFKFIWLSPNWMQLNWGRLPHGDQNSQKLMFFMLVLDRICGNQDSSAILKVDR